MSDAQASHPGFARPLAPAPGGRANCAEIEARGGNWNALRLYAVLLVIYGNGWVLTGGPGSGLWGAPFAQGGLAFLFAIGGYLASESWARDKRTGRFLLRRARRVWPGLIVCVGITALVIGPMATTLTLRSYLLYGQTRAYLGNTLLDLHLFLPGVFQGQQWSGAVNPMLWTLLAGALGCLGIPALGRLRPVPRACVASGLAVLSGSWGLWLTYGHTGPPIQFAKLDLAALLSMLAFFAAGAACRAAEARVPALFRADAAILCFAANWVAASWLGWQAIPLEWLTIPYMAIAFGRLSAPVLTGLGRLGNPSYGAFLYAFPIQQLIVARLPGDRLPILTCGVLSVGLGLLSWHVVERPALDIAWRRLAR